MDRYDHKPNADMLLHDLSRILKDRSVTVRFPDHVRPQVEGPLERIHGAVDSFLEDNHLVDTTGQYSDDEYSIVEITERQAWNEIVEALRLISEDISDSDIETYLGPLIRLWGEKLVALRTRQFEETRQRYYDECERAINANNSEN